MMTSRRVWRALPLVVLGLFACGGTSLHRGNEQVGGDVGGSSGAGGTDSGGNNPTIIAGSSAPAQGGYGGAFAGNSGFSGNSCFEAGSLVATPGGSVPIELLRIGDPVLAFDERTSSVTPRRVTATFIHEVAQSGRLALADGRVLRVTAEHPIYDASRGAYVRADAFDGDETLVTLVQTMRPGDASGASTSTGSPSLGLASSDVRGFVRHAVEGSVAVYNISVEGLENYFVESVLVHNKSGSGNNVCTPISPPWTAGTCKSQSACVSPSAPERDDVQLNEPVEVAADGAPGSAGAGGESSAGETSSPVSVSLCPGGQLEAVALLALDYRMPDTLDGTPGFAVYTGDACSGMQLGEVWLNDYAAPPLGSLTTQCVYLPLTSLPSNISVHSLHAGGEATNLRFVSSCACQRELRTATSCGPSAPRRQCLNAP